MDIEDKRRELQQWGDRSREGKPVSYAREHTVHWSPEFIYGKPGSLPTIGTSRRCGECGRFMRPADATFHPDWAELEHEPPFRYAKLGCYLCPACEAKPRIWLASAAGMTP